MAGKNQNQNKKNEKQKVEIEKPHVKNMFNPNVGPDIRFTNVEHNQIGLPFQFGRPKPKSTRAAPQERPR